MVINPIEKFSKHFILNKKNFSVDQNLIENFVNNNYFENLLINLTEINPYDVKIANEFSKINAISSLPHLRILKTSLNLTTERFLLELSHLVSPFNKDLSKNLKFLSSSIIEKLPSILFIKGLIFSGFKVLNIFTRSKSDFL